MPNARAPTGTGTGMARPKPTYKVLITMAIKSTPAQKMTLDSIYHYIRQSFPYYQDANHPRPQMWRNNVRHELSVSDQFAMKPREALDGPNVCCVAGCGNYWTLAGGNSSASAGSAAANPTFSSPGSSGGGAGGGANGASAPTMGVRQMQMQMQQRHAPPLPPLPPLPPHHTAASTSNARQTDYKTLSGKSDTSESRKGRQITGEELRKIKRIKQQTQRRKHGGRGIELPLPATFLGELPSFGEGFGGLAAAGGGAGPPSSSPLLLPFLSFGSRDTAVGFGGGLSSLGAIGESFVSPSAPPRPSCVAAERGFDEALEETAALAKTSEAQQPVMSFPAPFDGMPVTWTGGQSSPPVGSGFAVALSPMLALPPVAPRCMRRPPNRATRRSFSEFHELLRNASDEFEHMSVAA